LLIAVLLLTSQTAAAIPGPLPDENGKFIGMEEYKGEPVLVYVAKLRETAESGDWEKKLTQSYPQLQYFIVADIDILIEPPEEFIAKILRGVVPKGVNVAIDMKSEWAKEYDLDTDTLCLVLFDAEHKLVGSYRGEADDKLVAEVEAKLATLFPATAETK